MLRREVAHLRDAQLVALASVPAVEVRLCYCGAADERDRLALQLLAELGEPTRIVAASPRPHDLALAEGDAGFHAQVRTVHRLADRITVELAVAGQQRALELDLVDRPDLQVPVIGADVRVQALRYRVFAAA